VHRAVSRLVGSRRQKPRCLPYSGVSVPQGRRARLKTLEESRSCGSQARAQTTAQCRLLVLRPAVIQLRPIDTRRYAASPPAQPAELLKHSTPSQVADSCTRTCFRRIAADSPAGPAPTMHTSYSIASRGSRAPAGTAAREAAALACRSLLCGAGHVQRCRQCCRALRHTPEKAMA